MITMWKALRRWYVAGALGAVLAGGATYGAMAATGSPAPAAAAHTTAGCMAAMSAQIRYAESHPGSGAGMTSYPPACDGLSAAQQQQAAMDAVTAQMP
jgi:hypothetical protein